MRIPPDKLRMMAVSHPAAYASYMAVQRAAKRYPGVRRFAVDHSGPELVARPMVESPVERQQDQLDRRLAAMRAQAERSLTERLAEIQRSL